MNLTIPRSELDRGLRLAASVAARKPTMPLLGCVLLRASAGRLTLAATDTQLSLQAELKADVSKPGDIALGAQDLRQFVASAPGDSISIATDGTWADVRSGKAKYRMAGHAGRDFPKMPEVPAGRDADAVALQEMLSRAGYAVSNDETRPMICGVLVEVDGDSCKVASTSGHMGVRMVRKLAMPSPTGGGQAIVMARGATEIVKLLDGHVRCTVSFDARRIYVTADEITIAAALIDQTFPPIDRVIPDTHKASAVVDREKLIAAIQRVSPCTTDTRGVRFASTQSGLSLASADGEGEEMHDEIDCEVDGDIKICVAPKYVLNALQHMAGDAITMRVIGELDPMVLVDNNDAGHTAVIMPMRYD